MANNQIESASFTITPAKTLLYLSKNGWQTFEGEQDERLPYVVYRKANDYYSQVLVPKRPGTGYSYQLFVNEMVKTISHFDKKNETVVYEEIRNSDKKIIYIRYYDENRNNYNIPANIFDDLIVNSKKLYMAAYLDANSPAKERKSYRYGKYTNDMKAIEKSIEFGQTQGGSYIIPMLVPYVKNDSLLEEDQSSKTIVNMNDLSAVCDLGQDTDNAVEKMINTIETVKSLIDSEKDLAILTDPESSNFTSIDYLKSLSKIGDSQSFMVEFSASITTSQTMARSSIETRYLNPIGDFVKSFSR